MKEASQALRLELQVPAELAQAVTDQVRGRLHDEVTAIVDAFHLDSTVELTVVPHAPGPEPAHRSDAVVALSANGKRLSLRDGELERIVGYVRGSSIIGPIHDGAGVWPDLVAAGEPAVGDTLALLCRAVLGPQLADVLTEHPLRELIDIGAPLPDAPSTPPESPAAFEELLATLPPPRFELAIHPDYLRELSRSDERTDLFPFMWEGLFVELGLSSPASTLRFDSSLRARAFQFRIGGITGVPLIGLDLDHVLVNDTPERLAFMNVDAVATMNPATRQPAAIVAADRKTFLEDAGLTTWDPWGYLILTCAAAIRENAWRFMTRPVAERMLDVVGRAFPALASAMRELVPREMLPRVLRELLFDQVPVRDLSAICEALLRRSTDAGQADSDAVLLARRRQRYTIAHKFGRGTDTLVVYLLDPALESQDMSDPAAAAGLRAAVATELAYLPPTAQQPAVLTLDTQRRGVRQALRHRFPSLTVLGHGDIPPEWNVQPVARIALT